MAMIVATTVVRFRHERGRGGRDGGLHAADVVGDARLHLAGAGLGEEGQRHALQVRVDGGTQVVHDPLPHLGRHVGLRHAEGAVGDRHDDHAEREQRQQAGSPLGQGYVDDLADQERVDQRDEGRSADEDGDEQQAPSVRAEEPQDTPGRHVRVSGTQ
jgi:hypothetical protein